MSNETDAEGELDVLLNKRAEECWTLLNTSTPLTTTSGLFCPGTFDGWSCWQDTPAGTSARAPCPEFITGFDPNSRRRIQ